MSSRLTAPSDNPRENANPADVVAIALKPKCCKYLAVPMSHGFGSPKQPLSCSLRNSVRFSSIDFMDSGAIGQFPSDWCSRKAALLRRARAAKSPAHLAHLLVRRPLIPRE